MYGLPWILAPTRKDHESLVSRRLTVALHLRLDLHPVVPVEQVVLDVVRAVGDEDPPVALPLDVVASRHVEVDEVAAEDRDRVRLLEAGRDRLHPVELRVHLRVRVEARPPVAHDEAEARERVDARLEHDEARDELARIEGPRQEREVHLELAHLSQVRDRLVADRQEGAHRAVVGPQLVVELDVARLGCARWPGRLRAAVALGRRAAPRAGLRWLRRLRRWGRRDGRLLGTRAERQQGDGDDDRDSHLRRAGAGSNVTGGVAWLPERGKIVKSAVSSRC